MKSFIAAAAFALCLVFAASCNMGEEEAASAKEGAAAEGRPELICLPKNFEDGSEAEFQKRRLAWFLKDNLGAFARTGQQDADWTPDARSFIEKACRSHCAQIGAPDWPSLEKEGLALIAKSCDDPFVHFWFGEAMRRCGKLKEAMPHFRRAASRFQRGGYPKLALALAADRLSEALAGDFSEEGRLLMGASANVAASASVEAAADVEEYSAPASNFVFREMLFLWGASNTPSFWEKALKAAKGSPSVPSWLTRMVEAEEIFESASRDAEIPRGARPSRGKMERFRAAVEKAADIASGVWSEVRDAPEAPSFILELLAAAPDANACGDAATWFKRAIRAQPDYFPAYLNYMDWLAASSPDPEEAVLKFGADCLATGRFDTDVPRVCLAAVFKIASGKADFNWRSAFARRGVPEMIGLLYEGLLAQPVPDDARARLSLESAVLLAWCGKYEEAKDALNKIPVEGMNFQAVFPDFKVPWRPTAKYDFESELRAFTGPFKERFAQWRSLILSGDKAAAGAALSKLLQSCVNDKGVRKFLREWAALSMLGLPASRMPAEAIDNPLAYSLRNSRPDIAKFLIDNGADLKPKEKGDSGLLILALESGQPEDIVKLLVMRGAGIDGKDASGATPLHLALRKGQTGAATFLVEMGADMDVKDSSGSTPLHLAVSGGYPELVRLMLKRHAKPETQNADGDTALHLAAKTGSREIVEAILDRGGKNSIKNSEGKTAAETASQSGHYEIASLIEKTPAGPQKRK